MRPSRVAFLILSFTILLISTAQARTTIRVNGLGYARHGVKMAVVVSDTSLIDRGFLVFTAEGEQVYEGTLGVDQGRYLSGSHHFTADFSAVTAPGRYYLRLGEVFSPPIEIVDNPYTTLPDSILRFFHVQRCGNTGAELHKPCHLHDATYTLYEKGGGRPIDATGGWHDAGDYTKFTLTAAQATYFLLLAHQMHPDHSPDHDGNGTADVLDEARVGLDWLLKVHPDSNRFYIQVQDNRDHTVGWRMPEDDPLELDRPAFANSSQAICGIYSAALALGALVFYDQGEQTFADSLLLNARSSWDHAFTGIPAISSGPDSMYYDRSETDNLALGAAELYRATGEDRFKQAAVDYAAALEPRQWLSWGDLDNFALIRVGTFDQPSLLKAGQALAKFQRAADGNPYAYPLPSYPWGSATVQMGVAALSILYANEAGTDVYLPMALRQADFVTGMNNHGVSFIVGVGRLFPKRIHHQIAHLTGVQLTGALVGGYVDQATLDALNVQYERRDRFRSLQTEEAVYRDDRLDYVSNEPTVMGNALTYFVFSWFAARGVPVAEGAGGGLPGGK